MTLKQVKQDRRFIERLNLWLLKENLKWFFTKGLWWVRSKIRIPFTHRKVKTLLVHSGEKSSQIKYGYLLRGIFRTKDGEVARGIVIDLDSKAWRMDYCHDVAHLLTLHLLNSNEYIDVSLKTMRIELTAWRIAKSYCKKRYWNEEESMKSLLTYIDDMPRQRQFINVSKLKKIGIIPLNKGLRIPRL